MCAIRSPGQSNHPTIDRKANIASSDDDRAVREFYRAYAEQDGEALLKLMAEDLEVHVSGNHSLSGHYRGQQEVFGYFGRVGAWTGGEGGFEVQSVLTDEEGHAAAIVTATASTTE